jgi:hypothetical protein
MSYWSEQDSRLQAYRNMSQNYLTVMSLTVRQFSVESGEFLQSVEVVLGDEKSHELQLAFAGVRDLRVADLRPGVKCRLAITRIEAHQLEGLRYQVHNMEQDFTLSFYCQEFNAIQSPP